MRKLLIGVLLVVGSLYSSKAQQTRCAHDEHRAQDYLQDSVAYLLAEQRFEAAVQDYIRRNPNSNYLPNPGQSLQGGDSCPQAKYIIPVVVHIFYDPNNPVTQLSQAYVEDQIEILNKAFRNESGAGANAVNTGIQFCLAKKKPNNQSFSGINWFADTLGDHDRKDYSKLVNKVHYYEDYLDIYIVYNLKDGLGTTKGYASYPEQLSPKKGIVVKYDWFGNYTSGSPFNQNSKGMTLVHEVGHYLGLYHTFQGGCSGTTKVNCSTEGDKCCDTPPVAGKVENCNSQNTCTESYNGDRFDQKENFMDYTPETCVNTFTADQANRMYTALHKYYPEHWHPDNVDALNLTCCVNSAQFLHEGFICANKIVSFQAYNYSSASYTWRVFESVTKTLVYNKTTSTPNDNWIPTNSGTYDLELTLTIGTKKVVMRKDSALQVGNCTKPLKDVKANWIFGHYAGVRFYEEGVYPRTDVYQDYSRNNAAQLSSSEPSLSISDSLGNLLFYVGSSNWKVTGDTMTVWDSELNEMVGSPIIKGGWSNNQGLLSVPDPGNSARYYIFQNTYYSNIWPEGFYYSIVDLSKTSVTKGEVVLKDQELKDGSNQSIYTKEGLTAIPKCDDKSYWILQNAKDLSTGNTVFHVYTLDTSGPAWHSTYQVGKADTFFAAFDVSPNGRMIQHNGDLYNFDRSSGTITLRYRENDSTSTFRAAQQGAFSPDSRLVYRQEVHRDASKPGALGWPHIVYQLDPFAKDVGGSKRLIMDDNSNGRHNIQMQVGPDSILYLSEGLSQHFIEIDQPNKRIPNTQGYQGRTQIGFKYNGLDFTGGNSDIQSWVGLPNFVDAHKEGDVALGFSFGYASCDTIEFMSDKCCGDSYSWNFGDGESSTAKDPTHVYTSNGEYVVTLTVDGQTAVDTVLIGIDPDLAIVGPTSICDLNATYTYTVPQTGIKGELEYTWSAQNASLQQDYGDWFDVIWNGTGSVKLIARDLASGCVDSITINIDTTNSITNNTISVSQNWCQYDASGSTPQGGNGSFTYQWFKGDHNKGFEAVSGATNKDFPSSTTERAELIYRTVYSGGCQNSSNIDTIQSAGVDNDISAVNSLCIVGDTIAFTGSDMSDNGSHNVYYTWQQSLDGSNWSSFGTNSANQTKNQYTDTVWYRRKGQYTFPLCISYSNEILITPDVFITQQPKNDTLCGEFDTWTFEVFFSNEKHVPISLWWQKKDSGTVSWDSELSATTPITSHAGHATSSNGDSFRFILRTPCGDILSDGVQMTVVGPPTITTHPIDVYAQAGDHATFSSGVSGYSSGVFWQKLENGNLDWEDIPNSNTTTLTVSRVNICDDSARYRMVIKSRCDYVYSNTARLHVTDLADIWMRDSKLDIGLEPNSPAGNPTLNLYRSPDLWNCASSPVCNKHQDAVYNPSAPNHARVRIHNKGTDTTQPTMLRVYWSRGSVGQQWDKHWTANSANMFHNQDDGNYYPKGGEITLGDPIEVSPIPPGQSLIYTVGWFPPNPAWYYTTLYGNRIYQDFVPVCLLARIEECENYPHAMTFDEVFKVDVATNVLNNNNIVIRNFVSRNSLDGSGVISGIWIGTGDQGDGEPNRDIEFNPKDPVDLDVWEVELTLDDTLWNRWQAAGATGNDFEVVANNKLKVTGPNFSIDDIDFSDGAEAYVGLEFTPLLPTDSIPVDSFVFTLSQKANNSSNIDGGFIIQLDNSQETMSGGGSAPMIDPEEEEEIIWETQPNPAHDEFSVDFKLLTNKEVEIEMVDLTGRVIRKIDKKFYKRGEYSVPIDIQGLDKAMYIVYFKYDHHVKSRKILID